MEDNIAFGFEIASAVVCSLIGGFQVYKTSKLVKKHKKLSKYQDFVEKNKVQSVDSAINTSVKQFDNSKEKQFILVEGQAVSGAFILKKNAKKWDANQSKEHLKKLHKIYNKPVLLSRNEYIKQGLFRDHKFDQDIEGQNFYLLENHSTNTLSNEELGYIQIQPSSKVHMQGFNVIQKKSEESLSSSGWNRFINSFLSMGSYLMYTKFSEIVYEGDKVKVFGTFIFNPFANRWEIENPIAFINGSVDGYVDHLQSEKIWNGFSIFGRAIVLAGCVAGLGWASYRLMGRFKKHLQKLARQRLEEQDRANRIRDAPPFVREGVDKIEIESFTCLDCKREARNIIYLPCKHCELCEKCYKQKQNKFQCEKCNAKIDKLIKIYVSSNNE
eukprot:403334513